MPRATLQSVRLATLLDPACMGVSALSLVARDPFHEEEALPFTIHGGGAVLRVVPYGAFRKEHLAATADERAVIVDCPDAPGWLVPTDVLRDWYAHHVHNDTLEDMILSHPLYEHLTRTDHKGHSRGGRVPVTRWEPGLPNQVQLLAPEFVPHDRSAPAINRDRRAYAEAVEHLLENLRAAWPIEELHVTFAMA